MITIKVDDASVRKMIAAAGKQGRYAAAVALTRTAKVIEKDLARDMAAGFSSASPYSLKSQYVAPATKATLTAMVGIKDKKPARGVSPAVLLKEHFTGGRRGNKPMEVAMSSRSILPSGYNVVPGAGIKTDRYGNPAKKDVAEILGALKSGFGVYAGKGKRAATVGYFVVPVVRPKKVQHLVPGIYKRIANAGGSVLKPMFLFIKAAAYHRLFDLQALGDKVVKRDFARIFGQEFAKAIATAK